MLIKKDNYMMIDIMKVIMALAVISIHTEPLKNCTNAIAVGLYDVFTRQAVPFFFITSGFFLRKKMRDMISDAERCIVLKNYLFKIAKMYVKWTIIYLPFEIFYILKEQQNVFIYLKKYLLRFMFLGDNYCSWQLWYLLATIYAIITIIIFFRFGKSNKINILCIITMICMIIGTLYIKDNYIRMLSGLLYILLGMIVEEIKINIGVSLCSYGTVIAMNLCSYNNVIKQFLYILSAIFFFDIIRNIKMRSNNILQKEIRKMSKYIYLTHMAVWFIYDEIKYGQRGYGVKEFAVTTLGTIMVSVICCYCSYIIHKMRNKREIDIKQILKDNGHN